MISKWMQKRHVPYAFLCFALAFDNTSTHVAIKMITSKIPKNDLQYKTTVKTNMVSQSGSLCLLLRIIKTETKTCSTRRAHVFNVDFNY